MLGALVSGGASPRTEVLHDYDFFNGRGAVQLGSFKLVLGQLGAWGTPDAVFSAQGESSGSCAAPYPAAGHDPQLHAAVDAGEPTVVAGLEARGAARVAAMRAAQPPRRLRRAVALVLRAAHRW